MLSGWAKPFIRITYQGKQVSKVDNRDGGSINPVKVDLEKGKRYQIVLEYKNYYGSSDVRLLWSVPEQNRLQKAVEVAKKADVVILNLGLNERLEGEEMRIELEGFSRGDRTNLNLPKTQIDLMNAIYATGKPIVLVLINGSALAVNWASENIPAIITAGYPGQQGGNAVADVLFGDYNPQVVFL